MDKDPFELEPPIDGPDKEANEKALQEQLQSYYAALESEWTDGVNYTEGKLTPEQIRDKTEELLTQAIPKAVARLTYIIEHGKNENAQLKAALAVIDRGIGDGGVIPADPLTRLLEGLKANDPVAD